MRPTVTSPDHPKAVFIEFRKETWPYVTFLLMRSIIDLKIKGNNTPGEVAVHAFNSSTWEAEASGSLKSSRSAWSTKQVPGKPGLQTALSQQNNNKNLHSY